jgi:HNH endonuclease
MKPKETKPTRGMQPKRQAYMRAWNLAHPGRTKQRREYLRAWWKANSKRVLKHKRSEREANPELFRERSRAHRAAHPGYRREEEAAWRKANPEKRTAGERKRRARKRGQTVHYTPQEWQTLKRQLGYRCVSCWKTEAELNLLGRKLVGDHIISLSRGGLDSIENIQPLCHGKSGCNDKKQAKTKDFLIS